MCTPNELHIILRKISEAYRMTYGEKLIKIILYGSYARGDYEKNSDIDIVAIVDGERMALQQNLKKYGIYLLI